MHHWIWWTYLLGMRCWICWKLFSLCRRLYGRQLRYLHCWFLPKFQPMPFLHFKRQRKLPSMCKHTQLHFLRNRVHWADLQRMQHWVLWRRNDLHHLHRHRSKLFVMLQRSNLLSLHHWIRRFDLFGVRCWVYWRLLCLCLGIYGDQLLDLQHGLLPKFQPMPFLHFKRQRKLLPMRQRTELHFLQHRVHWADLQRMQRRLLRRRDGLHHLHEH
jgi:hypothetical protein